MPFKSAKDRLATNPFNRSVERTRNGRQRFCHSSDRSAPLWSAHVQRQSACMPIADLPNREKELVARGCTVQDTDARVRPCCASSTCVIRHFERHEALAFSCTLTIPVSN